ncbi:hypothetical protein RHGRI_005158 [Rhododendron griersonianum]|uniref:Protein arginine N-methyltransferase domain-containing protein n=1 Tax=Rhododendron griersonianum TaxID=479676 RepID=A0AAV6LDN6_9ERIC|nr:hypothetical protein RHGRI_005158 [Rhododendron griersonianum]
MLATTSYLDMLNDSRRNRAFCQAIDKSITKPLHVLDIGLTLTQLSEPFKIFEFDFWRRPESRGESKLLIKAINDGTVHAVVSWYILYCNMWILQLDREGTLYYSTGPKWIGLEEGMGSGDWCDHWKQCVYFVPGKGLSVSKDEELPLHAIHTDISISYEFEIQAFRREVELYDFAQEDQLILLPERVAVYGDSNWRCSIRSC